MLCNSSPILRLGLSIAPVPRQTSFSFSSSVFLNFLLSADVPHTEKLFQLKLQLPEVERCVTIAFQTQYFIFPYGGGE